MLRAVTRPALWQARCVPRRVRPRNDVGQYDDLVDEWWEPRGQFAMLHWIAAARAELIPQASRPGAVLLDLACGGGLMAPYVARLGYRHVGVDLTGSALERARAAGVRVLRGDVARVPLRSGVADVVVAGEILEHVVDYGAVVDETARLLRPGGLLVLDTVAATRRARLLVVTVAERIPGMAPAGIHDPALFVPPADLVRSCQRHGITLQLRGIRPSVTGALGFLTGRRDDARLVPARSTAVLYQGWGRSPSSSPRAEAAA